MWYISHDSKIVANFAAHEYITCYILHYQWLWSYTTQFIPWGEHYGFHNFAPFFRIINTLIPWLSPKMTLSWWYCSRAEVTPVKLECDSMDLTLNVRGPSYLSLTRSISWLLMPWLLTSPGHQQPWYWLCRMGRFLSYLRKDFNYLRHTNVEKWHKM